MFRKMRTDRYTEGASGYVTRTYEPAPPAKKEPSVKYSLRKSDISIRSGEREMYGTASVTRIRSLHKVINSGRMPLSSSLPCIR